MVTCEAMSKRARIRPTIKVIVRRILSRTLWRKWRYSGVCFETNLRRVKKRTKLPVKTDVPPVKKNKITPTTGKSWGPKKIITTPHNNQLTISDTNKRDIKKNVQIYFLLAVIPSTTCPAWIALNASYTGRLFNTSLPVQSLSLCGGKR